jgi:putative ABC transport system permease protein
MRWDINEMKRKSLKPPKIATWILNASAATTEDVSLLGDLEEEYRIRSQKYTPLKTKLWYWTQILVSIPPSIKTSIYWSTEMIKNYLKIAWRNIQKHGVFSFINITGLAIGMACCIMILLWVQDELSFDTFHTNRDNIYRVVADWEKYDWKGLEASPAPLAPAIEEQLPEIRHAVRVAPHSRLVFHYKDKAFYEDRGLITDPSFFDVFTFSFIKGEPTAAFKEFSDFVITESMAQKYFGSENPIGKTIQVEGQPATVTGVLRDIPHNSHLQFDFVSSFEFIKELSNYNTSWGAYNFTTYVYVHDGVDSQDLAKKMTALALKNESPQVKDGLQFRLQPLSEVYLDARSYQFPIVTLGDAKYVLLFTIVAFFVLLIACVNFMNLSTARSSLRAKEVGMRKTVGAYRSQIVKQFFGESLLLTIVSSLIALVLVALFLPAFNELSGKHMFLSGTNTYQLLSLLAIVLLTGIIAGSYPAVYLSAFRPVAVLKGMKELKSKKVSFRNILVVVQFSLSIMLIFGTTVIYKQLHYIQRAKLGFDKENIVHVPIKENIGKKYEIVKNELLKNPNILSVSAQRYAFSETTWRSSGVFNWEGKDPEQRVDLVFAGVEYGFFKTLNLEIKEGRPFSKEVASDERGGFILNESAIKKIDLDAPVGKRFAIRKKEGTIIGVVKDAHFRSFHHEIEPRVFFIADMTHAEDAGLVMIRILGGKTPEALSHIERVWRDINPVSPFEYHFLDQTYDQLYGSEKRIGTIFNMFTALAIFISCLGLFGLASFMAEQRTKEIGIRKVLGASSSKIITLLTKEFTKWVLVANLIAWPVAYFVMKKLLQVYVYRTAIGIDTFLLSGLTALMVALLTVSYQALKAARSNPADSLRYE